MCAHLLYENQICILIRLSYLSYLSLSKYEGFFYTQQSWLVWLLVLFFLLYRNTGKAIKILLFVIVIDDRYWNIVSLRLLLKSLQRSLMRSDELTGFPIIFLVRHLESFKEELNL